MDPGDIEITDEDVEGLLKTLDKSAEEHGYHLNPDIEFVRDLVRGLLVNEKRYGYLACPCRLATGRKEDDLDIICPCDYRDPDLSEYGQCYCALYVTKDVLKGKKKPQSIPERRGVKKTSRPEPSDVKLNESGLSYPVYRCKVCGYLCARDEPPDECPICKAKKERFERFI